MSYLRCLLIRLLLGLMVVYEQCEFAVQSTLSNSSDDHSVPIDYNSANDDGPRPFGLLLIIVLIISLLIGTSITYYVCCTTPEPIQKKKYPSEGKTTKTKKVTKNAPKKKDHNTKKKPNKGKKEPKTVTILTGNKTKSKAPKSLVGSGSSKSKSAANSNSSKANKTKDIKDADNVKSTIYKSLVNGKRDGNKVTMTPLLKKNILGQNVSQVSSMGNLSCRLSKDSVSPRSSNAASANTKTTAMTKMPPLTRRNQKEVSSKKKKLY